jgi:hypothetical protein
MSSLADRLQGWALRRDLKEPARPQIEPKILILTPLKNAIFDLPGYVERVRTLSYPHRSISLGFLEGDSSDTTFELITKLLPALDRDFRSAKLWSVDYGYHIPPMIHRGDGGIQFQRRTVLAKSRNQLLFRALNDEDWVLWLDVDVIEYPADLIERLLATKRDIVQPHCVFDYGGPTFDLNAWRDHGRLHMDDLRDEGEFVELDTVGGTVLFIRADVHREGLIFPAFPYGEHNPRIRPDRGELETEGLGIMARDMGYIPWGMPNFEVLHRRH